jgi:hypothetical protein
MVNDETFIRTLARLLPREFRERVFDPALADLRVDAIGRTHREQASSRLRFAFECVRLGVRQHVWHRGRPTRLGNAIFLALLVSALVVQRISYARMQITAAADATPVNAGSKPHLSVRERPSSVARVGPADSR